MDERVDPLKNLFRFARHTRETACTPSSRPEEPALLQPIQITWEWAIAVITLAFAVFVRFYGLADKPLHHDESLFAYYSYFLAQGYGYQYQPILHGPILEHVTALIFLLFGDSDFTMRLPAAVGSLGLFACLLGWRRYLGSRGTFVSLILLALSPSITYYSRFLRNDAPYLAATFWCAYAVLRAFETGERRYFWHAGIAATIMFCMMESSIFFFAACVAFFGLAVAVDLFRARFAPVAGPRDFPGRAAFFAPLEVSQAAATTWRKDVRTLSISLALGLGGALVVAYLYVRVLSDSLPMPGWTRMDDLWSPPLWQRVWEVYPLAVAAVVPIALLMGVNWHAPRGERGTLFYVLHVCWHRRWTLLAIGAFAVVAYATLFTTYFTHTEGPDFYGQTVRWTPLQIYKNTWDYWWDQHQQHRIKGPFHYHLPILFLYEWPAFAALVAGGAAALRSRGKWLHLCVIVVPQLCLLAYALAGGFSQWDWETIDRRWHVSHPFHFALVLFYVQTLLYVCGVLIARRAMVESFLLFWTISSLFAYSYAGEKVPWLSIHVAGPSILLAGLYVGRWVQRHPLRSLPLWVRMAAALVLLWQFRSVCFVAWIHPASPAERIVYNHTSPDVVQAVQKIEELAHDSQLGKSIPMLVKGEMEWPLYWYLRRYTNWGPTVQEDPAETSRPIVLVNWENVADYPNLVSEYEVQRLKVREWWEPPLLNFGALCDIWRLLTPRESRRSTENGQRLAESIEEWRKLWRYLIFREIWLDPVMPAYSNGANEFAFCVSKKFLQQITTYSWQT
ncbi:MAG: TIGR03663 family protein, partial [Candidatus Sumerlaeaceae bacterium]|nr:TIGR03663 family protein [Candidatus Sumerlaeaceae bacterium]